MSLLIYSPRCKFSMEVVDYINKHHQLKQIVQYHNINTQGMPQSYKSKITRVPTMLTQNGKILVGNEIKNWLDSLLPPKEISHGSVGGSGCGMSSLDGKGDHSDMFALDDYGKSLQPPMTKELEERISKSVSKGEPYTELKM
jgi:hypothetical protein